MKKIIVVLLLCISMFCASCGNEKINDEKDEEYSEHPIEKNEGSNIDQSDVNQNLTDNTMLTPGNTTGVGYCKPHIWRFDTIEDLVECVDAVNAGNEVLEQYVQRTGHPDYYTGLVEEIAKKIESHVFPWTEKWRDIDEYVFDYYYDRNDLDICYRVDGILYRFVLWYSSAVIWKPIDKPVVATVEIGNQYVDLHEGENVFFGSGKFGNIVVEVYCYSKDLDKMDFSPFVITDFETFRKNVKDKSKQGEVEEDYSF